MESGLTFIHLRKKKQGFFTFCHSGTDAAFEPHGQEGKAAGRCGRYGLEQGMEENTPSIETLIRRIARQLQRVGISERAASLKATGQPDALRYIRKRMHMPSAPRLAAIARALQTSPAYLLGAVDDNAPNGAPFDAKNYLLSKGEWRPDEGDEMLLDDFVTVFPLVDVLIEDVFQVDGPVHAMVIDRGSEADIVRYPRPLKDYSGLYAIQARPIYGVAVDIVLIDPTRKPTVGDRVLIYIRESNKDVGEKGTEVVALALFERRTEKGIFCRLEGTGQRFPVQHIRKMHRVVTLREVLEV